MTDYDSFAVPLTAEIVKSGITRFTIVGDVTPVATQLHGNKYVFSATGNDKKRYEVTLYKNQFSPYPQFCRANNLKEDNGNSVTFKVRSYKGKDGTEKESLEIVKVEGPAQASL